MHACFFPDACKDGNGNWTNSGCLTSDLSLDGVVTCSCNHLTNFALLVVSYSTVAILLKNEFCHHSILQSTEPLVCGQNSRAAGEGFVCECLPGYDTLVEDNNSCTGNVYSSHLLHHWDLYNLIINL